jgi:hypothetical protein
LLSQWLSISFLHKKTSFGKGVAIPFFVVAFLELVAGYKLLPEVKKT